MALPIFLLICKGNCLKQSWSEVPRPNYPKSTRGLKTQLLQTVFFWLLLAVSCSTIQSGCSLGKGAPCKCVRTHRGWMFAEAAKESYNGKLCVDPLSGAPVLHHTRKTFFWKAVESYNFTARLVQSRLCPRWSLGVSNETLRHSDIFWLADPLKHLKLPISCFTALTCIGIDLLKSKPNGRDKNRTSWRPRHPEDWRRATVMSSSCYTYYGWKEIRSFDFQSFRSILLDFFSLV